MKNISARARSGDPVALRKFIHTVRHARTHREAFASLGMQERAFYRLLAFVRSEGHSV